jgi:hypothetical protein
MEVGCQLRASLLYPRRKTPRCQFDRWLGGPQNQIGWIALENRKHSLFLLGMEQRFVGSPTRSPVTVPTELTIAHCSGLTFSLNSS